MDFMDRLYDPDAGYLFYFNTALLHETRSSSWYSAGLLARNENDDREQAIKIINNIIAPQFQNASQQWYGDYQVYPEQPTPGTEAYPDVIYNSWDPNWRGFIGTAFIVILEEFSHLLPPALQVRMVRSLHLDAIGDTYRVGGVAGDNLYSSYSNAALMHTVLSAWVGYKTGDANLTAEGETWAREIVELFDRNSTLSEFNSPTYLGVSLFALTLWDRYLPPNSTLAANGGRMISAIWDLVGEMYNANMKNLAGPWDRSYGYDMNRYLSVMGLWIWSFVGLDRAPVYKKPWAVAHVDDLEIGPLIAILSPYHERFIGSNALKAFTSFPGTHVVHSSAYSPAYDHSQRNTTTFLSANLTIGVESFDENVVGGPNINQASFNPMVIQWLKNDGKTGFITLYPEVEAMQARVIPDDSGTRARVSLTYPYGNETSRFTFHVDSNGLAGPRDVASWADIEGIRVSVSNESTVDLVPSASFCGLVGGACDTINEFDFWNFTYAMPAGSPAVARIVLDLEMV
ncbi:Hypothetical predicted protein [Lecanosticta acicola]|uniref:Uncharacterized protein n=1 Tax=Lecanosticta acicola TaxID=111012 RepID=A0AAI8Z3C2_9PEZI|nr:Hypothetical predicted protein [Lecanosticta acicola]